MDREHQHVVVGRAAQHLDAVERPLHQIERLAENLLRQFLDRFRLRFAGESSRKRNIGLAALPDHLQDALFSRQEGDAQRLLPLHDPLERPSRLPQE